jgi:hypothetical protein
MLKERRWWFVFYVLAAANMLWLVPGYAADLVIPNHWVQEWLLCGPFPLQTAGADEPALQHQHGFETDFLQPHGGETALRVKAGQKEVHKAGTAVWKKWVSPDSIIDLDTAVSKQASVAAYAYREFVSDQEQLLFLSLGSNDGCRVWLNGERIWDYAAGRGLKPDQDLVPVLMRKGTNRLLLKIEERANLWRFCLRFLPMQEELLLQNDRLLSVSHKKDNTTWVRLLTPAPVFKRLCKSLQVQVYSDRKPETVLATANWSGANEMALAVPSDRYGNYKMKVNLEWRKGTTWSGEWLFSAGPRIEFALFKQGKSDYTIVLGDSASESEKWAVKELQAAIKQVGGVDLAVRSDNEPLTGHELVIGYNRHTRQLLSVSQPANGDESFSYQNLGPHLVIYGGKQRGTMYGVFTFLERELGCRWYTPRVTVMPHKEAYTFVDLYHHEKPGVRVRNDFYYEAFDPIWAAHNKVNGAMGYREQPGGVEAYWAVHTFYPLMPPEEFFAKHPEYYSLIDGQRIHDHAQLCVTNEDVVRILTERMRQSIKKNPQYLIYCLSQNDWRNPCQCEKCQAIARAEESEAGPIVWLVNRVAEALEKEFPGKYIGTLAYQYTRKPPKTIKPRENVVIRLCSIECCFSHDFNHCPENVSFVEDLKGWARIAPHMYIWDYVVNFSHYTMPYPNFRVLKSNIQTLRDNKAIGIMEQAAYQSRGGEFAELRAYVLAKLLWDPECDVDPVINDFMYGYYGRSGQYVAAYFDLLHNRLTPDTHIHLGLTPEDKLFSDEFVRQSEALFDQAETVADNEAIRQRVEMARLPIMYLKCLRTPVQAKADGTYERFNAIVQREGITLYAEAGETHKKSFHMKMDEAQ